jgi:hypothetical protein
VIARSALARRIEELLEVAAFVNAATAGRFFRNQAAPARRHRASAAG